MWSEREDEEQPADYGEYSPLPSVYKAAALSTKKLREEGAQQENRELLETMNNMLSQELHKVSFCLVQLGLKRLQVVNFG